MDETARDPCLQLQAALERVFSGAEDPALRAAIIAKNLYYHTANNGNNNSNAQPNYSWNTWVICQQFILYALIRFQFRLKVNAKLRPNINWSLMRSRLRLRLIHKPLEIPPVRFLVTTFNWRCARGFHGVWSGDGRCALPLESCWNRWWRWARSVHLAACHPERRRRSSPKPVQCVIFWYPTFMTLINCLLWSPANWLIATD